MRRLTWVLVLLIIGKSLPAQRVTYSTNLRDYRYTNRKMAGKAGDFYWLEKEKQKSIRRTGDFPGQIFFDVFDVRLNKVQECSGEVLPANTLKEYLVAGSDAFDQLIIVGGRNKTQVLLKRFSADGSESRPVRPIDSLPFTEDAGSFLLLQSANRKRLALIVFESTGDLPRRLHTFIFDADWNMLFRTTINANQINTPCIQDDFISLPSEDYDNLPIKLANTGEWYMSSPSTTGRNYNLYHFFPNGHCRMREIPLAPDYAIQDIALSLDDAGNGVSLGILSTFHQTTLKKLQTVHYSDARTAIDYDSAFYFNTNAGSIIRKNAVKDCLLPLPAGGYMFFTEYGRPEENASALLDPAAWETAYLFAGLAGDGASPKRITQSGYKGEPGLTYDPSLFIRGDMRMFYFPGHSGDSTWCGLIHETQNTAVNWPALSYGMLPQKNKILFMYNGGIGESNYATSTAVDLRGSLAEEPVLFWEFKRQLNFQYGQRISKYEMAIPYLEQPGFAVIRMDEAE